MKKWTPFIGKTKLTWMERRHVEAQESISANACRSLREMTATDFAIQKDGVVMAVYLRAI